MSVKIKCRGRLIETFPVGDSTTLSKSHIGLATIFFSMDEPIAISYKDSTVQDIMDFRSYGEMTIHNKTKLREVYNFKTIMPKQFDGELFQLLAKHENTVRVARR